MHTALVAGWAGSMALYELAIFDPNDPVLTQCGGKECSCYPYDAWASPNLGWLSINGGNATDPGIWSFEGVAAAHIILSAVVPSLALGLLIWNSLETLAPVNLL